MDAPRNDAHPSEGGLPFVGDSDPVAFRHQLLTWFEGHARDLPWRQTSDPWAILVSEIMLQQTRVATVIPYWERWMARWPTAVALAEADLEEALKSWEGLGYYRRARMLHGAASVVRDRHGGRVPGSVEELRALPGVGAYTAGAVASIAFGRAVPAVDGNVRRVFARLFDLPSPTDGTLRDLATALVDPDRPGDFNQALMELGATVCTPRSPDCPACPLSGACAARAARSQEARPLPRKRTPVPERLHRVALVVRSGPDGAPEALMRRRPADGLLGGMWEFPATAAGEYVEPPDALAAEIVAAVGGELSDEPPVCLPTVIHVYSHFVGRYEPCVFPVTADGADGRPPDGDTSGVEDLAWVGLEDPGDRPVPVAQQKIAGRALDHLATSEATR